MYKKLRKRSNSIKPEWLTSYRLTIFSRDTWGSVILSVLCRFCFLLGSEKVDKKTREGVPISVVKHWLKRRALFRTNNFMSHHRLQHEKKWNVSESLRMKEKKTFFDVKKSFAGTIVAHFGTNKRELNSHTNASIVESVLKGILMEVSLNVCTVSPWFKFSLNDMMYDIKVPNKKCSKWLFDRLRLVPLSG